MCGLAGILTDGATEETLRANAREMADAIRHRGPDDEGVWCDASAGIALGHRRLSIVDLSAAGHQPMTSASGRWVIAYNGEIYNHLELRNQLGAENKAPCWRGHSDTETLLAAVEAWGVAEALKRATGMFALAAWDRHDRVLWLARDRIGEKPLYYGWQGHTFLFGSELKALCAHPAFRPEVDRGALALLLRRNYVPAPTSIYKGIRKLPAGTYVRYGREQRESEPVAYWSTPEEALIRSKQPFEGSELEALETLQRLLGNSVRAQMIADVPLGALLSGGIDSTTIAALMQDSSSRPIRTFTIGFDEAAYDEGTYARAVAMHLGTEHTELRLSAADALALIPRLPTIYDEPFADSSQLPTHLVMQLAQRHVKVALSGDGGDEFFGGYNRYFLGPKAWRWMQRLPQTLRHWLGRAMLVLPPSTVNTLLGPLARKAGIALPGDKLHKLGQRLRHIDSLDALYVSMVSEWAGVDDLAVGAVRQRDLIDQSDAWPSIEDPIMRMMVLDAQTYLPDDILVKVDRAAMATSLETRAPFLSPEVMQFAWSLPVAMKIRDGRGKWLLRRLVERYVPRELMDRPKMGFGIPLDHWLRGPLRDWAESLLAQDRLRREGYLNPAPIRAAWQKQLKGEASYGYRLWSVLMFQSWLEARGVASQ